MPKVDILNMEGSVVDSLELNDAVFGIEPNHSALHQVVKAQLANKRQGTQSALTRSEVSGGGIKPWVRKALAVPAKDPPAARSGVMAALYLRPNRAATARM